MSVAQIDPAATAEQRVTEIERTLRTFHAARSVVEIRFLRIRPARGKPHNAAGYFDDFTKAAKLVVKFEEGRKIEGVHFTLNEINPALLARCPNAIEAWPKATTADSDVIRRRWLLIDIDPARPAGTPQ